jgi:hypothetical protein
MIKKLLLVLVLLAVFSCGKMILVPPEIDLIRYERIGLISFSIENAKGRLDEIATQRFIQEITWHQRGIQVIELGTLEEVLKKVNKEKIDQEAAKAIGEKFGVTSFFYGNIKISDVKPHLDISSIIKRMRVRTSFSASITARFLLTETGATFWTDSVLREGTLAYLSIGKDQIPYFDIRDEDKSYQRFIEHMIHDLTIDFRPTKRRVRS